MAGAPAGGGAARGAGRGAGALLGPELCAVVLLCWLCCWPDDGSESGSHRRPGDFFCRRIASSAVSLHLPSTSGSAKIPLSAHRSHEEIPRRRSQPDARYHSAPSVIHEVIHRRDWERSSKDLYIPLHPPSDCKSIRSDISSSPEQAPCAEPESSSIECLKPEAPSKKCKKHHTNIKSSKGKKCKESNRDDIKDTDATESEIPSFYIGELVEESPMHKLEVDFVEYERLSEERNRSIYKAKDAKQCFNESIKMKEFPRPLRAVHEGCDDVAYDVTDDVIDGVDRSGAVHHTIESRLSFSRPYPPPSVETVGYEGGACYLAEVGSVSSLRQRGTEAAVVAAVEATAGAGAGAGALGVMRARHASDGDILAPMHRPESGAFSESDLDIDMEALAGEELPPPYHELQLYTQPKKETAI